MTTKRLKQAFVFLVVIVCLYATVNVGGEWGAAYGQTGPTPTPPRNVRISISNATVSEGDAGTTSLVFTVSLSRPAIRPVSVDYCTADGSATAGTDYVSKCGTVVFAPGQTQKQITIQVNGDMVDERNETLRVILSNPRNGTLAKKTGIGIIIDDDDEPAVTISDASVVEGDNGTSFAEFTVSLSKASGRLASVSYTTADGSATAPSDYAAKTGTLIFPPGITSRTIRVEIVGDEQVEPNENFAVGLYNQTNVAIADGTGIGRIVNDD